MIISIDYDLTYSRDPEGFEIFKTMMELRGHTVVCCTARAFPPTKPEPVPSFPIYCTAMGQKHEYMLEQGIHVDVWIDDNPATIPPRFLLEDEKEVSADTCMRVANMLKYGDLGTEEEKTIGYNVARACAAFIRKEKININPLTWETRD